MPLHVRQEYRDTGRRHGLGRLLRIWVRGLGSHVVHKRRVRGWQERKSSKHRKMQPAACPPHHGVQDAGERRAEEVYRLNLG